MIAKHLRGAHASRVLATASPAVADFFFHFWFFKETLKKDCFGETPKPARGTRALPRG
jgi:hypothetical protein